MNKPVAMVASLLLGGPAAAVDVSSLELRTVPAVLGPTTPFVLELGGVLADGCGWSIADGQISTGFTGVVTIDLVRDTTGPCGPPKHDRVAMGPFEIATNLGARQVDLRVSVNDVDLPPLDVTVVAQDALPELILQPGLYWSPLRPGNAVVVQSMADSLFAAAYAFETGVPTWKTVQGPLTGGVLEGDVNEFMDGPEFPLDGGPIFPTALARASGPARLFVRGQAQFYFTTGDRIGQALLLTQFPLAFVRDDQEEIDVPTFVMPDLSGEWVLVDTAASPPTSRFVSWQKVLDLDRTSDVTFEDSRNGENLVCKTTRTRPDDFSCLLRDGGRRTTFHASDIGTHRLYSAQLQAFRLD